HVILNYKSPVFDYQRLFDVSLFPMPYMIVDYLMVIIGSLLSVQLAGKIVLSMYVVLLPTSIFYFIRSVDKTRIILVLFAFLFIYNWHFNKGFVSFVFSIPFFFFTLGYWWRAKNLTWSRQLILSGLILCVYLSHLYTFLFLIYAFALLLILTRDHR